MKQTWSKQISKNFSAAALNYNSRATLQHKTATLLAEICSKQSIKKGFWVDLGTGTGLLADSLESFCKELRVLRIDNSFEMLATHNAHAKSQLWDLNKGLPIWRQSPDLIASSFALHWLLNPQKRIEEWFLALAPKGWLAIALPILGSFEEWHLAAKLANVNCTALPLPKCSSLIQGLPEQSIQYQRIYNFTQSAPSVAELLRPIKLIGASGTSERSLTINEWRQLKKAWLSCNKEGIFTLTWCIQILLIQK